jgi:E3 ubiquitin-protein ligase HECTD2
MPPWPPRVQLHSSNSTTSHTSPSQIDTSRPLPPLPSTAIDLGVPTLHSRRRGEPEGASAKHGRSFSHPFPSFFGGSKRTEKRNTMKNRIQVDSTDEDESIGDGRSKQSSTAPSRNPSVNAGGDPMTGRCMACDSTVRWPRDLKVFRCTICLTVNDLDSYQETNQQPLGTDQNNMHPLFAVPRKRTHKLKCCLWPRS